MRKNSIKNTRINEEVLHELSNIIRGEIKDPRINEFTSVVSVEVAPDLKTMKSHRRARLKDLTVQEDISRTGLPSQLILEIHLRLLLSSISL